MSLPKRAWVPLGLSNTLFPFSAIYRNSCYSTVNVILSMDFQVIPAKNLEPYRNGTQCGSRGTCLLCLSDAACGWCQSAAACMSRMPSRVARASPVPCAASLDGSVPRELLVLDPEYCITCSSFIYCQDCVKVRLACQAQGQEPRMECLPQSNRKHFEKFLFVHRLGYGTIISVFTSCSLIPCTRDENQVLRLF